MTDASLAFLSVLRRGLAAGIAADAPAGPRVAVSVSLSVNGQAASGLPALALRGAGDVIGFDGSQVTRVWPSAGSASAEPNYFAIAEFGDPDLPWRYTPQATAGDRLPPWLCLVVVKDAEVISLDAATQGRPLGMLTVNDAGALPDLTQAWAWAHAQVVGSPPSPATDFDAATVAMLLAQSPQLLSSRLVCPRKLDPETPYTACIVPTFERGRCAGLGQPVDGVDRATLAWAAGATQVTLPVYFSWRFQTGQPGDFASLVHLLTARADLPAAVWQRDLSLSTPGVAPPAWVTVGLQGALLPVGIDAPAWPGLDTQGFSAAMAALIDREKTTLMGPTMYGRWLAATATLDTSAGATPPWVHQLNADPRARVAAGLGTQVVQAAQQDLLAQAWNQVDGIRRINQRLRLTQFSREMATRLHDRHLALGGDALVQVLAPLHAQVLSGASTVHALLAAAPIATGAVGAAWRRASRTFGSLGARQGRPAQPLAPAAAGALARMNAGSLTIAPAPTPAVAPVPGVPVRLGDLGVTLALAKRQVTGLASVSIPSGFTVTRAPVVAVAVLNAPVRVVATASQAASAAHDATAALLPTTPAPKPVVVTHPVAPPIVIAKPPGIVVKPPVVGAPVVIGPPVVVVGPPVVVVAPPAPTPPAIAATAFAQAAGVLMQQLSTALPAGLQWVTADLPGLGGTLVDALHPKKTIEATLAARLSGVAAGPTRTDPIEPVMAAPRIAQAMYAPLATQSTAWLIPGLDQLPDNTVATLHTNWPFVESYLVGLNHEFARKLLWNGYPTDQRGTYFRRFWDNRASDGSAAPDVGAITQWSGALGANRVAGQDPLVLLVRGELVRRYPDMIVYAAQAVSSGGVRTPGTNELQPMFFARLDPDVTLFGFALDPAVARADPGWFFVLAEHPSLPRFGLAAPGIAFGAQPASWDVLGWDHLCADAAALGTLRYIDLDAVLPQSPAAADPQGAVWHAGGNPGTRAGDLAHLTFRRPQRLAVHASVLIAAGIAS